MHGSKNSHEISLGIKDRKLFEIILKIKSSLKIPLCIKDPKITQTSLVNSSKNYQKQLFDIKKQVFDIEKMLFDIKIKSLILI